MSLFSRKLPYDRKRILADAERARARGRTRRAVRFYRQILAAEPHDPELNAKIAPLLAKRGATFDAWQAYERAARALIQGNQAKHALDLYRNATRLLPREREAWLAVARLERSAGRSAQALEALLEGRRHQKGRSRRPEAIWLLREARAIEPWNGEVVLDLARVLAKNGQKDEAIWVLEGLTGRQKGAELRPTRALQFRLDPTVGNLWRWMRA